MKRILGMALIFAFAAGCRGDELGTGVLLSIDLPSELESEAVSLRARVGSGAVRADLKLRGDRTVDAPEWPAEVLLRATDPDRAWKAELWALDERGAILATGEAEGWFLEGDVRTVRVSLASQRSDERDGGAEEGGAPTNNARDSGAEPDAATNRDAGMQQPRDARAGDEQPVSPPMEGGVPVDASRDARAHEAETGPPTRQDASEPAPIVDASGGACPTAPTYPLNTVCQRCACQRCATQVTTCFASSEEPKNVLCRSVQRCAEAAQCAGQSCYCGGTSALACLAPEGPCRGEIETAAGGTGLTAVTNASTEPESPVARSAALRECQMQNCRAECGL